MPIHPHGATHGLPSGPEIVHLKMDLEEAVLQSVGTPSSEPYSAGPLLNVLLEHPEACRALAAWSDPVPEAPLPDEMKVAAVTRGDVTVHFAADPDDAPTVAEASGFAQFTEPFAEIIASGCDSHQILHGNPLPVIELGGRPWQLLSITAMSPAGDRHLVIAPADDYGEGPPHPRTVDEERIEAAASVHEQLRRAQAERPVPAG